MSRHCSDAKQRNSKRYKRIHAELAEYADKVKARTKPHRKKARSKKFKDTGEIDV